MIRSSKWQYSGYCVTQYTKPKEYADDYEDLADAINNDYYDYDKNEIEKDDFDMSR